MTPCSPAPSSPTRSRPGVECHFGRPGSAGAWLLAGALALGVLPSAHGHGQEADDVPLAPGWRLNAGLALDAMHARDAWPQARLPGVLLTGQAEPDRAGHLALEQGRLSLGLRLNAVWGMQWSASAHDHDSLRTETARLALSTPLAGGELRAHLGRQGVSMGPVIDAAGSFDRFAQQPLAKQATVNGQWEDDGLALQWQQPEEDGQRLVELGAWRARGFPGGPQGPVAPSVRLGWAQGHASAQVFGAWLAPTGRGAAAISATGGSGHLHGVPDCTQSVTHLVCLDGHSRLLGASLAYDGWAGVALSLAALARHEHGTLYASSATADYQGSVVGVWADAAWALTPAWRLAARLERLVPRQRLSGPNPATLAQEAGLADARSLQRASVALGWQPAVAGLQTWLEAGSQQRSGSTAQPWVGVRLLWQGQHTRAW